MAKHTPGPWIACDLNTGSSSDTAVWRTNGRSDFYLNEPQICECFVGDDDTEPHVLQAEANARLIAAAPDLLAALQDMVAMFSGYQGVQLTLAKQAIEKATGFSGSQGTKHG